MDLTFLIPLLLDNSGSLFIIAVSITVAITVALIVYYAVTAYKNRLPPPDIGPQAPTYSNHINFYGDSIGYGGYVKPDGTAGRLDVPPGRQLEIGTGMTLTDYTVNGDTLTNIYKTFFKDGHDGQFTVIEAGINDASTGKPIEKILRTMIEFEKTFGRKVILTGLSRTDRMNIKLWKAHNNTIIKLAKEYGLPAPLFSAVYFRGGNKDLMDLIHPNQEYSNALYGTVIANIKEAATK